ncbi:hypothetical protein CSW30_02575 [Thermus scotoductus]|uniref:Uncharacterized protein n=2 Tax=Thermus scotoductus TaxID=37636 RepID=A0A430USE2_THESC|nr:hypothetical protein [Thermus scotoductus]RTI11359.1 hypothetical protein CSW30_02575 [Thermus scotoductus]
MRTRYLIALALATLARQAERLPLTPEEKALLARIWEGLNPVNPTHLEETEARRRAWSLVADEVARRIADGWDEYGAPTVAKHPSGGFFAHYQGPNGERIVEASSKREAYRKARKPTFRTPFTPAGNIARPPGGAPRSRDGEPG